MDLGRIAPYGRSTTWTAWATNPARAGHRLAVTICRPGPLGAGDHGMAVQH